MRKEFAMAFISRPAISCAQALAWLAVLTTGPAMAQVGPGNAAQPNTTIPEKQAKPSSSAADLTKKKDGVIVPKHDVDPDMSKVPPGPTGDKNVIPPKETAGGAPGADPK
jgi:hypothetical protein